MFYYTNILKERTSGAARRALLAEPQLTDDFCRKARARFAFFRIVKGFLQLSLLLHVGLTQSTANADRFRNPFQSAAAIAQGNAFDAQADDASAVFYNPAGMTQLRGIQHVGGVELVNVDTHFRGLNGRTTENDLGGPFGFPPPLQMFLTARPKDRNISSLGELTIDKAPAWHHLGIDLA